MNAASLQMVAAMPAPSAMRAPLYSGGGGVTPAQGQGFVPVAGAPMQGAAPGQGGQVAQGAQEFGLVRRQPQRSAHAVARRAPLPARKVGVGLCQNRVQGGHECIHGFATPGVRIRADRVSVTAEIDMPRLLQSLRQPWGAAPCTLSIKCLWSHFCAQPPPTPEAGHVPRQKFPPGRIG